jgi:hypothetical protein
MKILSARITAMPQSIFDPMPEVHVTLEDGSARMLFSYYPDEIRFDAAEFIGLTVADALALRHRKDVAYLQS